MTGKSPTPTFYLRLHGKDVLPESIPVRAVSDATAAIGRMVEDDENVKAVSIRLLKVRRGSAVYGCLADFPEKTLEQIRNAGAVSADPESELLTYRMMPAFKELSRISRSMKCEIDILDADNQKLATIGPQTYASVRGTATVADEAHVTGELVRVGGATANRCALRLPG